ncbi:hypothetical protein ACMGD3_24185 [Lysinibacillus sphaericus]|uniref:hypothetical protein n=1 Tax=Lysinibacillus sphaericus TaxID=1421 RepID=UPI003F798F70
MKRRKTFFCVMVFFLLVNTITSAFLIPNEALAEITLPPSSLDDTTEINVYYSNAACKNTNKNTEEFQGSWYYVGLTSVIDDETGEVLGKAYRYKNQIGRTVTMINPGSIESWVSSFGGDSHGILKDFEEGTLKTFFFQPTGNKTGFCRIIIDDILTSINATFSYKEASVLAVQVRKKPKVTKFLVENNPVNACFPLGTTTKIHAEAQAFTGIQETLTFEIYQYNTASKIANTVTKKEVKTDKNGKASITVPYEIKQFEEVELYLRVIDQQKHFDEDTEKLQNKVGSIKPVGQKLVVCGQYEGSQDEQALQIYNFKPEETLYYVPSLEDRGLAIRNNGRIKSYPSGDKVWLGKMRYPTIYKGTKSNGGFPTTSNSVMERPLGIKNENWKIAAYDFPFIHLIAPIDGEKKLKLDGFAHDSIRTTGYNVQLVQKVTASTVERLFNGNADHVLTETEQHPIYRYEDLELMGDFYYIRDLAESSGGEVTNETFSENKTALQVIQTDYPDISNFKVSGKSCKIGDPIKFDFEGYEYVSKTLDDAIRNDLNWSISIVSETGSAKDKNGTIQSNKSKENPSKQHLKKYTGQFSLKDISFTFKEKGRYSLELRVEDEVKRATTATLSFTVGDDKSSDCDEELEKEPSCDEEPCQPEIPNCKDLGLCPDIEDNKEEKCEDIEGADCGEEEKKIEECEGENCTPDKPEKPEVPIISPANYCALPYIPGETAEPYEHKIDFIVERIEGKTVPINTLTETPVNIARADFSEERNILKGSIKEHIKIHEQYAEDCKSMIKQTKQEIKVQEQVLAGLYEALAACMAQEGADCSGIIAQINAVVAILNQLYARLAKQEADLAQIEAVLEYLKAYLEIIENAEKKYAQLSTTLALYVNDNIRQVIVVTLSEGQKDVKKFKWKLEKDSLVAGYIDHKDDYPVCNGTASPCETTNDNNVKYTPIYISTYETADSCTIDGSTSYLKGIVRTIQEGNSMSDVQSFNEHIYTILEINEHEKERRAGYGFHYTVKTFYINDDISEHRSVLGVTEKRLKAYKPEMLTSYLDYPWKRWTTKKTHSTLIDQNKLKVEGYRIGLEETDKLVANAGKFTQNKVFELPIYSVEKLSGNVFEGNIDKASDHKEVDPSDTLLDGGRKWYLDYMQPYGDFVYNVIVQEIGVNKLSPCVSGEVLVQGKPIGDIEGDSDFIFRFVDANTPFPKGTGWNWTFESELITNIKEWFNHITGSDTPKDNHEEEYNIKHD